MLSASLKFSLKAFSARRACAMRSPPMEPEQSTNIFRLSPRGCSSMKAGVKESMPMTPFPSGARRLCPMSGARSSISKTKSLSRAACFVSCMRQSSACCSDSIRWVGLLIEALAKRPVSVMDKSNPCSAVMLVRGTWCGDKPPSRPASP